MPPTALVEDEHHTAAGIEEKTEGSRRESPHTARDPIAAEVRLVSDTIDMPLATNLTKEKNRDT